VKIVEIEIGLELLKV